MSPPARVDLSRYMSRDAQVIDSDSDHHSAAERLQWSEDEDRDAISKKLKKRKNDARAKERAEARKAKRAADNPSIVGRKSRGPIPATKRPRKNFNEDSEDSNDSAIEDAHPAYLKQRRSKWDKQYQRHGQEGLSIPPIYDEVFFSDDETDALVTKPVLPGLKPPAPYKDVELRYSAGVVPAPVAQWLREYQVAGAEFLHRLFVFQKGGILGDDMGLGKTIQVIAFLTAAFGKTGDERDAKRMRKMRRLGSVWYPKILIICPGSLMENWRDELNKWGWWHIQVYHGASRDLVLDTASSGRLEIMLTTYDTYRNKKDQVNLVEWDACIADECHRLKDRKSETTQAMDQVNALCRIGLTGTAIQNKYEELWTLLNWTNPGEFGPLSVWKASISLPLKIGQSHDATVAQLAIARKTAKKLVQNLLPQFFLRRMKTLIADQLPKKTDKVVFCPLSEIQSSAYERLVESEFVELIRRATELCDCESGLKRGWCHYTTLSDGTRWQAMVFPVLATLQKLSNHLAMLLPSGTDVKEKQERQLTMLQTAVPDEWKALYDSRDSIMNYANQSYCGKWRVLRKLLQFWHRDPLANNKVLVFSHSVRLLKMLHMLFQSTTSYNVSYLDGEMSYAERHEAVKSFNSDPAQFVFLISTKAGGVGLNITSANRVIVFDPNWNPAFDLQAQDRAYRIGQTRDVEVYRFVSQGTVEEIVYARQIYKQQQAAIAYEASEERRYFAGVQGATDKRGEIFGLANIFSFQGDSIVLRDIVNKTNVAESRAGIDAIEIGGLAGSSSQDGVDADEAAGEAEDGWSNREDAAMSQLAADIAEGEDRHSPPAGNRKTGGKRPMDTSAEGSAKKKSKAKTDAVAAILAGAGVEYTHENAEVVGTSRVEARLSRRAQAADSTQQGSEFVFAQQDSRHGVSGVNATTLDDPTIGDVEEEEEQEDNDKPRYRFHPPESVRNRLFVSLAHASTLR